MSDIEVRPVDLRTQAAAFYRFPWRIYGKDPHWVPPLLLERREFFNPDHNPYYQLAEVQCFMAFRGGQPVGTISAQVDKGYQEVEEGVGFFGFFEFIEDAAVASALLQVALEWLRARGMKDARGPFNFNTNHECGLLVDGFDDDPLVLMTWNRPYYPRIYEEIGLSYRKDLYAYWLDAGPIPANIDAIADRFARRNPDYVLRPVNLKRYEEEVEIARQLYNDAWAANWGFVKLTDAEFRLVAKGLKPMIDPRLCYVVEHKGEPIAFSMTLPDFNYVVKPMNGRLFPFGWLTYLARKSKWKRVRVFVLGVRQEYQSKPVGAMLYQKTWKAGLELGVVGAEASWILDDNIRMRGALEKLGGRIYKTYRIYGQEL